MTPRERGFLLLTSHLGDPARKVMTTAQLRTLVSRAATMEKPVDNAAMIPEDLIAIGYHREAAQRILDLLADEEILSWYLAQAARKDCYPITRVSKEYPGALRHRLGADCPGCLWAKGDKSLLLKPAVSLVGSRNLSPENLEFAAEVGKQAALQGYVLVSGNARGADKTAQDACLEQGGQVISVVADRLEDHSLQKNVLYLSENSFDSGFSAQRALSRNRVIHCLSDRVFVAQSSLGKGGTWDGVTKNLRKGWSSVYCFDDGSPASRELIQMGAEPIKPESLSRIHSLKEKDPNFF